MVQQSVLVDSCLQMKLRLCTLAARGLVARKDQSPLTPPFRPSVVPSSVTTDAQIDKLLVLDVPPPQCCAFVLSLVPNFLSLHLFFA